MSEPLLQVQALTKRYGSLKALDGIDFSLQPGEVIGLVGRRGAGKTTLLHILSGVSPYNQGEVIFRGRKMNLINVAQAREAGIELVSQTPHLAEQLDVVSNIFLGREIS